MANKSVLELAVGTGQWDAGLKKAKDALNNFTQAQGGLQNALKSDSDKMQQFVQMMGKMDSTAKTAKGQMNDYKGTIEQLTMQYNRMTDAQKKTIGQDYLQAIDQMKQKYQAVNKEIEEMNRQLKATPEITPSVSGSGGGLFGGNMMKGMLQVAGGNLITMAGSWAASLVGDVKDAIVESAELAKQAEGVQIAFTRLGRGDILDGLREATHGTVSDFELMKAAVKFNDFKLPLEELGSMLAFAQKKAKDTGQSVDYMVDSIVTGLGRKSLMILDNLGLSAAEIRDKMKETGDMTKAVGEIIREQMAKAGEYVDTTADKMNRAQAELNNAMLELGTTMREVTGFSGWSDMATAIKTEVVGALQFTIETIGEAKNAWNSFMQTIGVKDKPKKSGSSGGNQVFPDGTYWETTDSQGNVTASGRWLNGKRVQTGLGDVVVTGHTPDKSTPKTTPKPTKSVPKELTEMQSNQQRINELTQEYVKISDQSTQEVIDRQAAIREEIRLLEERNSKLKLYQEQAQGRFMGGEVQTNVLIGEDFRGFAAADLNVPGLSIDKLPTTKLVKDGNSMADAWKDAASAVQSVGEAFNQIKDPTVQASALVAKAIATIALGFAQATERASATGIFGWIASLTAGAASMMTAIGAIHNATGYAEGGIIKGNNFSGDNIFAGGAWVNAGELVLTRSQQSSLASQLQSNQQRGGSSQPYVTGDIIFLGLQNYLQANGYGQLVTTKMR